MYFKFITPKYCRYPQLQVSVPIWLDDLECSSNDTSLRLCSHSGTGQSDCQHSDDVILSCVGRKLYCLRVVIAARCTLELKVGLCPTRCHKVTSWHCFQLNLHYFITPRRACTAKETSDCSWTGLYIIIVSAKIILKLKKYSLSEVHFNTGRLLFKFNGLQYCFAAGQVFVAFANSGSVSFG